MTDLTEHVDGLVHEETQVTDRGLDLTVASVHRVTAAGRIDFGGGELEPAGTEPMSAVKRSEDDDYGWYRLESGTYLLEYNETLETEEAFTLQPRDALLERGAFHPTLEVDELHRVPITVAAGGLELKENARVSTLGV